MNLAELQAEVHALLRGERAPADVAGRLGVPAARLALYRDFVASHITRVLGKVYPYVAAWLSGPERDEVAAAFFREVPARDRELNACVRELPAWLATRPELVGRPWLPPLAQLEWELFAAFASELDVPALAPGSDPIVNPTVAVIAAPWALVPWLVAHPEAACVTPATTPPERLAAPQVALVLRRADTHRIGFHVADDALLFALKVVGERVPLATAADLARVPLARAEAALARAVAIGLVIPSSTDPRRG